MDPSWYPMTDPLRFLFRKKKAKVLETSFANHLADPEGLKVAGSDQAVEGDNNQQKKRLKAKLIYSQK